MTWEGLEEESEERDEGISDEGRGCIGDEDEEEGSVEESEGGGEEEEEGGDGEEEQRSGVSEGEEPSSEEEEEEGEGEEEVGFALATPYHDRGVGAGKPGLHVQQEGVRI